MTTGPTRRLNVYVIVACLVLMLPIVILLILAFGHGGYLKADLAVTRPCLMAGSRDEQERT